MNKYVLSIALLVASTGAFAQNRLVKKAQGLINQRHGFGLGCSGRFVPKAFCR